MSKDQTQSSPIRDNRLTTLSEIKLKNAEEKQLTGSIKDLVKIRRHFINLLILLFAWIASSFDIYLLNYLLKYMPGDIFRNTMTTNAADIPIVILTGFAYQKFGTKWCLTSAFTFAALGGVTIIFLST